MLMITFLFCSNAFAITIVDTGAPSPLNQRSNLHQTQWLAAQFNLNQPYILTDIEGYFYASISGGTVKIIIYGDNETDLPDTTNELYIAEFSFSESDYGQTNWYGISGLNLYLDAGTYWVSFENWDSATLVAAMPRYAPLPIINEARAYDSGGSMTWTGFDELDMGLRIQATTVTESTIDAILEFFDESVADETLTGDGPGSSANGRLNALRNMLEMAGELISIGDIDGACGQLSAALGKCDGVSPLPDFVDGPAASDLHDMILELMNELGCE